MPSAEAIQQHHYEHLANHLKTHPHLASNLEFWRHVSAVAPGPEKNHVLGPGHLSVQDSGGSLVYDAPLTSNSRRMALGGVSMGKVVMNTVWGESGQEAYIPLKGLGAQVVADAIVERMGAAGGNSDLLRELIAEVRRLADTPFVMDGFVHHGQFGKRVMHIVAGRVR